MKNKTTLNRLFLTILFCLTLASCAEKADFKINPGDTAIALGDSLTEGYQLDITNSWPSVFSTLTGVNTINAGISGDTSAQALQRVDDLMSETPQAKVVFISIGGNDFLRRQSSDQTKQNISAIIDKVRQKSKNPVLIAQPAASISALVGSLSDHALYKEIAEEKKVLLISNTWSKILSDNKLKLDPIHANAEGYKQFSQMLQSSLVKANALD